ncbi:MAG TPA: hypothetical protein DCS70_09045 [Acinetobacter nosocomialis]|uniref:Uncharacterized protein n=1 Tax=Acinetobacter nosocomialis TaxID=106654 RepID=A0AB36M419_ACINO|nr:hypothetical protein B9X58_06145 [Acinetobacter nosocomialis]HAS97471.1 hypothetical protein [Acinetobacter nosocomialis]
MSHNYIRTPWGDFPPVCVLKPLNSLKNGSPEDYLLAKGGDVNAAIRLIQAVLELEDFLNIHSKIGVYHPIIVPVLAQESLGKNRIPAVLAEMLGAYFGYEVCDDIVQTVRANHTNAGSYERIVRQPRFDGAVIEGRNYVILDDTVAMGGTLAALKGFIESRGGKVVMAIAITGFHVPSIDLVPKESMINTVKTKHPTLAEWWQYEFGFPLEYLTQGELGHFKKPESIDVIRSRLIEAGFQSSHEGS